MPNRDNSPAQPQEELPEESVKRIPVDCLDLDVLNPRLISKEIRESDEAIIAHLYRAEDLNELLQSIAANGYMDIEPFIVCKENGRLTVLEGNRRLAAVRLLRDDELSNKIFDVTQTRIRVPKINQHHRATLEKVSVYRVAHRKDADAFIGFKHINGAARWSSYAKAKFAARWHKTSGLPLIAIANQIGDSHQTIKRMVHAIHVLEQAENESLFDIEDRRNPRFSFSHLYTALSRPDYRKFLGLDAKWASYEPQPNPVSKKKEKHLTELLTWIYGSKQGDKNPVIQSQNPDLKRLGEVLDNPASLTVIRAGGSLEEAHESTLSADQRLAESLLLTRSKIREAIHNVRGFDGQNDSLVDIAEEIFETAKAIHERMKEKRQMFLIGKNE
ncbi:MAG: ParB/RepB/Spo0J family partition protein [Bacteroidetes bacterium]|nr:ParB/RepB/Spo0J family partition protein [Bacteroidota bacterium]MDE2673343.1 ParB/RepB/Spo0J family partition protein [Bacteroidota bacterium]